MVIKSNKWPIVFGLADDLTGVCDTAAQFAKYRFENWGAVTPASKGDPRFPVVFFNTETRCEMPDRVGGPIRTVLQYLEQIQPYIHFKKIDTLLRGHMAAELNVMFETRFDAALLVAAIPKIGRITIDAHQAFRDGQGDQICCTGGGDPVKTLDIMAVLANLPEVRKVKVGLSEIRSDDFNLSEVLQAPGKKVLIFDTETDDDIVTIIDRVWPHLDARTFFVGSLGLSEGLARYLSERQPFVNFCQKQTYSFQSQRLLIACGSPHATAQKQIQYLVKMGGARLLRLSPVDLENPDCHADQQAAQAIQSAFASQEIPILAISPEQGSSCKARSDLSGAFARVVHRAVSLNEVDGLVLIGGETAVAICRQLEIDSISVRGAVDVVAAYGHPHSRRRAFQVLVTKGGSVGGEATLKKIVDKFRHRPGVDRFSGVGHV